jgi:hypothetical protein
MAKTECCSVARAGRFRACEIAAPLFKKEISKTRRDLPMRTLYIGSILVVMVALFVISPDILAQFPARPGPAAGKAIPDLSGIWETHRAVPVTTETALCGIQSVCNALLRLEKGAAKKSEEPPMQPWAEEKYKAAREGTHDQADLGREDLNTNFSGCMPEGPTEMMLDNRRTFEMRQFPDMVLLLFDDDHWVRRIYTDGRRHPDGHPMTWMGHSIGKYEGDTLVVDTIGIKEQSWLDVQGHPHSDALHLVERIRRVSPNSLEYEYTIDDPKAYKETWTKKITHDLQPPGFQMLEGVLCEELLEIGTHYSTESSK